MHNMFPPLRAWQKPFRAFSICVREAFPISVIYIVYGYIKRITILSEIDMKYKKLVFFFIKKKILRENNKRTYY